MANSGGADQALGYYYRALELNPGYIRARSATSFLLICPSHNHRAQVQLGHIIYQSSCTFHVSHINIVPPR